MNRFFNNVGKCPEKNNCGQDQVCTKIIGGHICICKTGYSKEGKSCKDVDECGNLTCGPNEMCRNTIGSYICTCKKGYYREGKYCKDLNECANKNACCGEDNICVNTEGSYKCFCDKGYYYDGNYCRDTCNHSVACRDVDECAKSRDICENGKCVNTYGSYRCECNRGYRIRNGTCKRQVVSFAGNSFMVFKTPSSLLSTRTNIRITILPYKENGIIFYSDKKRRDFIGLAINNSHLEYRFYAGSGLGLVRSKNALTMDKWYNIELIRVNHKAEMIINVVNSSKGQSGHKFVYLDLDKNAYLGGLEKPTDDLEKNMGMEIGFHGCVGYLQIGDVTYDLSFPGPHIKQEGRVTTCTSYKDADKCPQETKCGKDETCTDIVGGYTCDCDIGYVRQGKSCTDSDECGKYTCGPNEMCLNTIGSYMCTCKYGYDREGRFCKDLNECTLLNVNCGQNAKCVNNDGSYKCLCNDGYHYDGKSCQDGLKAKWTEHRNFCKSASCNGRPGSFTLKKCKNTCQEKETCLMVEYHKSKGKCSLCDEAQLRTLNKKCGKMDRHNFYKKVVGNQTFTPRLPRTGTGLSILQADSKPRWLTLRELCVKVTSFQVKAGVTADECKHLCELDKRCVMVKYSKKRAKCWLSEYRNMGAKIRCDEYFDFYVQVLDECDGKKRKCQKHATCKIEKGHRYCECRRGFERYASECIDINECDNYENLCGAHAHCVNTAGSYKCRCDRGLTGDGFICEKEKVKLGKRNVV